MKPRTSPDWEHSPSGVGVVDEDLEGVPLEPSVELENDSGAGLLRLLARREVVLGGEELQEVGRGRRQHGPVRGKVLLADLKRGERSVSRFGNMFFFFRRRKSQMRLFV